MVHSEGWDSGILEDAFQPLEAPRGEDFFPDPTAIPMSPVASRPVRSTRPPGRVRRVVRAAPPLLQAKLQWLNPGAHVLERPRLLQALADHAERRLTVIAAEAGYGKTSLCSAYARGLRRPVVWYSLMPSDADLVVFGRYLLAGFRRHLPRFGRAFERALEEVKPGARAGEMLAGTLAHSLESVNGPPMLLVLDDFQDVSGNAAIVSFTSTLVRNLPPVLRVLIASRTPPPLSLELLRAREEVFELHSGHLRLTRDELSRLFAEVYARPLSEDDLTALEETTLGWPTAVHLVHETLQRSEGGTLADVLASFRASHLELHDYLSAEVFARLDDPSRRLLERTAILTRFDASLAERLLPGSRPRPVLDALARRGLLRTFGSGDQISYECHELVRTFVRQETVARHGEDAWRALEAEAAEALLERGESERALRHLLAARDAQRAARVARELAPLLLRQGRAPTLLAFLGDLPAALVQEDLELSLALADSHQAVGSWDQAESRYDALITRCRARAGADAIEGAVPSRVLECRALLGLGKVLNLRGRHEQVLGMAERGLAMTPASEIELRARLLQMKAGAHFYLGQFKAAGLVLDQVRAGLAGLAPGELMVQTIHNLAIAYASQGRYRDALREFRVALAQVRGTDSPRAPLYLSNLAFLHSDLGEIAEARAAAEEGLVASRRFSNRAQECICHQALAQALAQNGDLDGALVELKHAEELDAELRIEVIAADLLALRGRIFCARGEYRRAVEFLTQAVERCRERAEAPRLLECQTILAWCELRSGRARVARDQLASLVAQADAGENDSPRMRAHYWLGEALLALGDAAGAKSHLASALRLVRERGYHFFLRVQAREEPAPVLHALANGLEVDTVAGALSEAGPAVEPALIEMLERASGPAGEAAVSVLGEVGGARSLERFELLERRRTALRPAIRTARKHITERLARGAAVEAGHTEARRLLLFGPPRLEVDGRPMPASAWRAQRAFQLLVYFALHPRGASREQLIDRFWPGRQAAAGRRNFHPTLSYIRSVLPARPESPMLREGEFYRLNPAYPLACDAWEFDRCLEEARLAGDPAARREALARATALAPAPFLEGFFSDWADALQARMRDRIEKALLELGELKATAGEYDGALEAFRRAVELDEYRESARLAAIECLVRIGQRHAALAEYDRLKVVLRRELGIDPLPETEEGMQRLLRGESAHGWPIKPIPETPESDVPKPVAATAQARLKPRPRVSHA